jgi:hypothetical protein
VYHTTRQRPHAAERNYLPSDKGEMYFTQAQGTSHSHHRTPLEEISPT